MEIIRLEDFGRPLGQDRLYQADFTEKIFSDFAVGLWQETVPVTIIF